MKVGLYFGSFNPIHVGHLIIANHILNESDLQEIWFVVSPHNPLKEKASLANSYDRLEMVHLAIENKSGFSACSIEFNLPQPSYTIDTLAHLSEQFPHHQFSLLMGGDNLENLRKWKNYALILRDYQIYVYPRPNTVLGDLAAHPSVQITSTPLMEISSTYIRALIQNEKNIQYLVPDKVIHFIEMKNLYKKK